jgi:hypothetical protein
MEAPLEAGTRAVPGKGTKIMPKLSIAVAQQRMELRSKALAANSEELAHLEVPRNQLSAMSSQIKDLAADQASLTADKQEVTKRLGELVQAARKLLTFVDTGVRQHYGNRSEKLVEFGIQPFRSAPRVRLVGLDGQPVKKKKPAPAEAPASAHEPANTP